MASRALVIGVGRYDEDSEIPGYSTIEASAKAYGTVLGRDPRWEASAGPTVLKPDEVRTADSVMRALGKAVAAGEGAEDTLLVVYVGHGAYWPDVPGAQVHFAVGSSRANEPWTWLSAWCVYRAMRQSKAGLKVLIADCCYSNVLPQLGRESVLPGALGTRFRGTCVLTAVGGSVHNAWAYACENLPEPLNTCTPFSGHLLNVLGQGMPEHFGDLTLGALRTGVEEDIRGCGAGVHHRPRMLLNDVPEATALFTNHAEQRRTQSRALVTADDWVRELRLNVERDLDDLMRSPELLGEVVAILSNADDEGSHELACRVDRKAGELLTTPADFVTYWGAVEHAIPCDG
ncbi:hypothetical protein ACWD4G_21900 [Streptomyces sp. NPDC002643]